MNFTKKMVMTVFIGTGLSAIQSGMAQIDLPDGWEVKEGKVTSYPTAPGKTRENYEIKREGSPDVVLLTRHLDLQKILPVWIEKGYSTHYLMDLEGNVAEWLNPVAYKAQSFGKDFNDRAIGILVETPSHYEQTGQGSVVEKFTEEEVKTKLTDQILNPKQIEAIATFFPGLSVKIADDYYRAKHLDGSLEPGAYGFSRIENIQKLRDKLNAQPLS